MIETLRNAVRAAIAHGNTLANIRTDRWAATYRCATSDVEAEWQRALTQIPPNSDHAVEGK